MSEPTVDERYQHLHSNAAAFVENMRAMVAALKRDGDEDMATKLRVWCLMPWEAALRDDTSGDLWPVCEACGKPIKNEADRISGDAMDFHRSCLPGNQ